MNIAIVHYHLNRGGVTQVIVNHLRALDAALKGRERWRVALLYGGRRQDWPRELASQLASLQLTLCEIPELDYDQGPPRMGRIGASLEHRLKELGFSPEQTIVHVHNHSLGKNVSLPGAVAQLAAEGYALLLQIHDFAEDFRPDNYAPLVDALASHEGDGDLSRQLYPQMSNIHYAVLNGRDHRILQRAGIDASRLHRLPNPVLGLGPLPGRSRARAKLAQCRGIDADRPFLLYPVRGIRRKNIGEVLLLAATIDGTACFGFTLPPLNPVEKPSYEAWKELARSLDLPCVFEIGASGGMSFAENIAAADAIVTTSVAEGFGMVFLESWLAERPLVGRDLPEITADFLQAGIRQDHLYSRFSIPIEWLGKDAFAAMLWEKYVCVYQAYRGCSPDAGTFHRAVERLTRDDLVDFAMLDAKLQKEVICAVVSRPQYADRLRRLNRWLDRTPLAAEGEGGSATLWSELIQHNVRVVGEHYSLASSGKRLLALYRTAAASPRGDSLDPLLQPRQILDSLLDLSRFRPIRC